MGALASKDQCDEVRQRIAEIARSSEIVYDGATDPGLPQDLSDQGAFMPPVLLYCERPLETAKYMRWKLSVRSAPSCLTTTAPRQPPSPTWGRAAWSVPCLPDDAFAREMVLGIGAWHGRLLIGNRECGGESTGHGSPLPALIHGGPDVPAADRRWAAYAACCTTCSAPRCRFTHHAVP